MSYLPEGGAYKEESRRGEPSRSAPSLFNLKINNQSTTLKKTSSPLWLSGATQRAKSPASTVFTISIFQKASSLIGSSNDTFFPSHPASM